MSCVLPFCGVARVLPLSWAGLVISGLTTSWAPPAVAPAISRTACPSDLAKALMAGPEPTKVASSEPPSSAFTASPPALKVCVVSLVLPSSVLNRPCSTPRMAEACVTLGK